MINKLAKKSSDIASKAVDYKKAISFLSDSEKPEFLLRFAQNEAYILQAFLKRLEGIS